MIRLRAHFYIFTAVLILFRCSKSFVDTATYEALLPGSEYLFSSTEVPSHSSNDSVTVSKDVGASLQTRIATEVMSIVAWYRSDGLPKPTTFCDERAARRSHAMVAQVLFVALTTKCKYIQTEDAEQVYPLTHLP